MKVTHSRKVPSGGVEKFAKGKALTLRKEGKEKKAEETHQVAVDTHGSRRKVAMRDGEDSAICGTCK